MAGSNKTRRTPNTRKPVTIDLEAKPVKGEETPVDPAPMAADSATNTTQEDKGAEPVAFEELADKKTAEPTATVKDKPKTDDAKPAPSAVKPDVKKANGNKSSGALTGGLIGGLVALIGFGGLQWANVLPSFGGAQTQATDTTLLENDIAALKSQIAMLEENAADVSATALPSDVEAQLSAAAIAFEEATTRVDTLEQSVTGFEDRLSTLQTSVANLEPGEGGGASAALTNEMSALTDQLNSMQADIAGQNEKISASETAINEQIASLESRVEQVEELAADGGSNADVASAIASAGLKSAIDRGGAFMAELEAFATVSKNTEIIDGLRNYAAAGVPTINQLSDEFSSIANKIVATGQGLDEDATITDRLMQSARSLVQVRPVGEVEGETPGAIAARIETRLKSGDLAGAIAQWETLPDAAKDVSADFAEQMRARQRVDELVANALSGALASTTTN